MRSTSWRRAKRTAPGRPRLRPSAAERAQPTPEQFYPVKRYSDGWAWGLCPFHGDRSPSLAVNLESGYYKCQSAGAPPDQVAGGLGPSRWRSSPEGLSGARPKTFLHHGAPHY